MQVHSDMPELPTALAERLKSQYGVSEHDVNTIMSVDAFIDIKLDGEHQTGSITNYFERVVAEGVDAKTAINWYAACLHIDSLDVRANTAAHPGSPTSCWDS